MTRTRNCPHYKDLYLKEKAKNAEMRRTLSGKTMDLPRPEDWDDYNPETVREALSRYELTPLTFEKISGQTEKAWAVRLDDERDAEWFPKSQCSIAGPNTLMVPMWLIWEKNLSI